LRHKGKAVTKVGVRGIAIMDIPSMAHYRRALYHVESNFYRLDNAPFPRRHEYQPDLSAIPVLSGCVPFSGFGVFTALRKPRVRPDPSRPSPGNEYLQPSIAVVFFFFVMGRKNEHDNTPTCSLR